MYDMEKVAAGKVLVSLPKQEQRLEKAASRL